MYDYQKIQTMEKNHDKSQVGSNPIYACFEQAQTPSILPYLSIIQETESSPFYLTFNSEDGASSNSLAKRQKIYPFCRVFDLNEKFKFCFGSNVQQIVKALLKGESQSIFVYGTEQKSKDKLIFGQSQNSGLLLSLLAQLFDQSHQNQMEEAITIKLSCTLFKNGKFCDILSGQETPLINDRFENQTLFTLPEIIIRNVKTGLKLLNIILKTVKDNRTQNSTENIIYTLKLQLDHEKKDDEVTAYLLSKLNIIKLGNPSINSSLKGVNKNNAWFVNLFNFLQGESVINGQGEEFCTGGRDEFTCYLKEVIFGGAFKLHGFISITNKMTSNQCLTALIFANYLTHFKCMKKKSILKLTTINSECKKLEKEIIRLFAFPTYHQLKFPLLSFLSLIINYMNELNFLEYQHSIILTEACQKLNKYIFTEDLEDFFYSKKVNVNCVDDVVSTNCSVKKIRIDLLTLKTKILKECQKDNHARKVFEDFLDLTLSMASHFLFEKSHQFEEQLYAMTFIKQTKQDNQILQQIEEQKPNTINPQRYLSLPHQKSMKKKPRSSFYNSTTQLKIPEPFETQKKKNLSPVRPSLIKKSNGTTHKPIDQLESMFNNKNVTLKTKAKKI